MEKNYYIICLELLASTLAVNTFIKSQMNKQFLLLLDNQTAVVHVNKLDGTVSTQATLIARNLWMCMPKERRFTVSSASPT